MAARKPIKPEWAEAGTFPDAWDVVDIYTSRLQTEDYAKTMQGYLATCRVITLPADQLKVLPRQHTEFSVSNDQNLQLINEAREILRHTHFPFDPLYLSLPGLTVSDIDPKTNRSYDMLGALSARNNENDYPKIFPILRDSSRKLPDGLMPLGYIGLHHDGDNWEYSRSVDDPSGEIFNEKQQKDIQALLFRSAILVANVLYFLDSSNVEVIDTPLSRQQRRTVERKDQQIASTIQIKLPKRRREDKTPRRHNPRDWSHRWEVFGHYRHHQVGNRIADANPSLLRPCLEHGMCRRVYCRSYVKGPTNKPLIPKVRAFNLTNETG